MSKALIPGSFDPITNGHLDIIRRTSSLFDEVIVLVSKNASKNYMLCSKKRTALVEDAVKELPNVTVMCYDGLLVDFAAENGIDVTVKGIRNDKDYSYEENMAGANMLLSKSAEITIETNPGTITNEKLGIYKSCGINRISIGAQSMQDSELLSLGRIHSAAQTIEAINMIQKAGFTNYNIDLMLAIPNQTLKSLEDTLNKAVSLCPTHISAYSLIVEEGTPFSDMANAGNLFLPDEDTERGMYEFAVSFLKSHGYNHYEISNFAKQGYECRHNLKYWSCESYIGIGAAAHSYYDGKRYQNTSNTNAYINMINENKGCIIDEQILSFDDMVSEYIIMALRLTEGISLNDFYKRFGFKFEEKYENTIEKYTTAGFLEKTPTHIRFTPKGISVSNSILCEFV